MTRASSQVKIVFKRLVATVLVLTLLVLLVAGTLSVLYQNQCATHICFGVRVHGIPVGGLEPLQATKFLENELSGTASSLVLLYTETDQWALSTASLGGNLDIQTAVDQAWNLGRSDGYVKDMFTRARLLVVGYNIEPAFHLETAAATRMIGNLTRNPGTIAAAASTWVSGLQSQTAEPTNPESIDLGQTCANIELAVQQGIGASGWRTSKNATPGALEPVPAAIAYYNSTQPQGDTSAAMSQLEELLREPLKVMAVLDSLNEQGHVTPITRTWLIDQATLSAWSELEMVQAAETSDIRLCLKDELVREWIRGIAESIAQPPREGRFSYDAATNSLNTHRPGQIGYGLDVEASVKAIEKACLSGATQAYLVVRSIPPLVTRADLEAMMPLALISQGETSFYGSSPDRLQNIKVATNCFEGITIPANSTFSFLDRLGDVTVASGYSESWIIYGDRTILGPGGGVCQVSTTCFRAAFYGGYPLVERHPHSYRVSWYEPPVGLDAAVFSPSTDMVFMNDQNTPILVQTVIDEAHSKLYFQFYGTPSGRVIDVQGPYLVNPIAAPDPIYIDNPDLPEGTTIQQEYAHDGLDTSITRRIYENGELVSQDEIESHYRPWAARYIVGTGN